METPDDDVVAALIALDSLGDELLAALGRFRRIHERLCELGVLAADELLTPERIIGGE